MDVLRVCDLTTGVAGPLATRWLAAFGAEVIKVENTRRPDPARELAPLAPGASGPDRSAHFNNLNAGKLGMAVDLDSRRGRKLAAELAELCPVVVLDAADDIEFDHRKARVVAVAPVSDGAHPLAWMNLLNVILLGLHAPEPPAAPMTTPEPVGDGQVSGGQRETHTCRDGQVAVEVRDPGDRAALAVAVGDDAAQWCRQRSRWEVEAELKAVAVPVAARRTPGERVDGDIGTGSRHLWPMVDHPDWGGIRVEGLAVELSNRRWAITEPAPTLGQDTGWVLSHLLGYTDADIERFQRLGVIA